MARPCPCVCPLVDYCLRRRDKIDGLMRDAQSEGASVRGEQMQDAVRLYLDEIDQSNRRDRPDERTT